MQTFSSVEAEVVARWNLKQMSTDTQRVTLKSPKMSNDDDKQSSYRLMNALCRAKAIFTDFSYLAHANLCLLILAISHIVCHSKIEALLISGDLSCCFMFQ